MNRAKEFAKKKYSKKVREKAAIALSICACDRSGYRVTRTYDVIEYGSDPDDLASLAFAICYHQDRTTAEVYAEAEALIRSGWSPGDEL